MYLVVFVSEDILDIAAAHEIIIIPGIGRGLLGFLLLASASAEGGFGD